MESDDKEEDYGLIRPNLIKTLRSILDQYPDDGQILKELLQNAEDAGASRVQFLYDGHSYGTKRLHDEDMSAFQGPALFAYNNALFNEADWRGIRMLQDSIKEKDPMKVGRFGLGFKSVLHMTDLPSVLSGDRIYVIDPHEKFFKYDGDKTTGYRWHLQQKKKDMEKIPDQFEPYKGKFDCNDQTFSDGYFNGTMFRFPLRTQKSQLSDTLYDDVRINGLFKNFEADAHLLLMFLKNIQCIELLMRRCDEEDADIQFRVEISERSREIVDQKRKQFSEKYKQGGASTAPASVTYPIEIETTAFENKNVKEKKVYRFLVNEYFAGNQVSPELEILVNDITLGYKPLVGTSMPLQVEHSGDSSDEKDEENLEIKPNGQVFCFLPLPVEQKSPTGLPVHVNGYFSISQNRRHLKWPTYGQDYQSDKSLKWNHCLLEELVPKSYIELISHAVFFSKKYKNMVNSADVYHAMPNLMMVDEKWQVLLEPLYTTLLMHEVFYSRVNGGNWIGLDKCIVDCLKESSDTKEILIDVLLKAGVPVIQIPMHVLMAVGAYCDNSLDEISPSLVRSKMKQYPMTYTNCSVENKMLLLKYVLKDEDFADFESINLLPVSSGNFTEFSQNSEPVLVPTKDCPKELLPGLDEMILAENLEDFVQKKLYTLAQTRFTQLQILDENIVVSLIPKVLPKEWSSQKVVTFDESSSLPYSWFECLWKFLRTHYPSDLSVITGHPVLPLDNNRTTTQFVPLTIPSSVVCKSAMGTELPSGVCDVLMKLGVYVVEELPDFVNAHAAVMGNYVHLPLPLDVVQSMSIVHKRLGPSYIDIMRDDITDIERSALMSFLAKISHGELSGKLERFLKLLPLFETTDKTREQYRLVSVQEVWKAVPEHNLPIELEDTYLSLTSEDETQVAKLLGVIFTSTTSMFMETILPKIKSRSYSNEQIQNIMHHVLENVTIFSKDDPNFLSKLGDVPFIPTDSGELEKPNCLFDPEITILKDMFAEQSLFPSGIYCQNENLILLRKIGLKNVLDITPKDVLYSAFYLDEMASKFSIDSGSSVDEDDLSGNAAYDKIDKKGLAILRFLSKKPEQLTVVANGKKLAEWLMEVCWMPLLKKKPELFPKSLTWKAACMPLPIGKPKDMVSFEHALLIGSHKVVTRKVVPPQLLSVFHWDKLPDVNLVIQQLSSLIQNYQSNEKAKCMALLTGVYDHLAKCSSEEVMGILEQNNLETWVWQGDGFTSIDKVFFKRQFADLRPYVFSIPSELEPFHEMFAACGMKSKCSSESLTDILEEIQDKYEDGIEQSKNTEDVNRDLMLAVDILNHLKITVDELSEDLLQQILVPAQPTKEKALRLLPTSELTYCDTEWLRQGFDLMTFDEQDGITFIHDNVPIPTAEALQVPTLMSRMLHAEELDITGFGQSEPLTDRLKRLLEDYTDGLAIPKELIQNADDAHATKVKFLFDERKNTDHMKFLIDEGMKECQGSALWVYNNAVFTEDDFDNIVKLGGATKEKEIDKIGKFGLGFNAVYNITDVPSFISQKSIVIFDPHTTHLGRGIHDRSKPGIKIDMLKNKTLLRKLPDQFQPYNGVFGCETGADTEGYYDGTLFRLPLRTRQQAASSLICNTAYDKNEVVRLLEMTIRNAHNLLLFTQNVIEVEFYHLAEGTKPEDAKLMFAIHKEPIMFIRELACKVPKLPENANLTSDLVQLISNSNFLTAVSKYMNFKKKMVNRRNVSIPQIPQSTMTIKTVPKLTEDGQKVLGIKNEPQEEYWLISSCMGQEKSLAFAQDKEFGDFLPIAGVALNLKKEKDGFFPQTHNRGLAFCYLPLPVPVGLPVHINAAFAIQSSRRCLYDKTDDDKHNIKYHWNQLLIEDAVVHAYMQLLSDLSKVLPTEIDVPLYQVWPSAHAVSPYFKILIASFYGCVSTLPQMKIACMNGASISFASAVFLDPAFNKVTQVKSADNSSHKENPAKAAALNVFSQVVKDQVIVSVPESFFSGFKQAGCGDMLKQKTYDVLRFYSQIFFPNIEHIDAESRDTLVVFALLKEDKALDELLNQYNCIAVSPDGSTLRKPSEVIYPSAVAARMFNVEDGRFPFGIMAEGHILKALKRLGMIINELDWEDLYDRAASVIERYDLTVELGRQRLTYVVAAVDRKLSYTETLQRKQRHDGAKDNSIELKKSEMATKFMTLPFLPTRRKPKHFPVKWLGCENTDDDDWCPSLMSAQDMYSFDFRYLVSATQPIVDEESMGIRVKKFLGFGDIQPSHPHVITQAEHAMQVNINELNKEGYMELHRVFYNIYKHLQDVCKEDMDMAEMIKTAFGNREIILIGNYMVVPEKVSFYHYYQGAPYLFSLPDDMARNFQFLMKLLGVRERFNVKDYVETLRSMHEKYEKRKMDENHVKLSVGFVAQLNESMKHEQVKAAEVEEKHGTIYLPSIEGVLQPASALCYNDCPWVVNTETMNFIHRDITLHASDILGVKTKRQEVLKKHATGFPFGQKENLVTSLNRLLTNYPLDHEVLKELIQNADDAGATEIHFILDSRNHRDKLVFEDSWKPLQGPALLVYNNKPFLQKDLEAIQRLGESSKIHDPTKTGQYGVGFSSVYHLTDVPCILTSVPDSGSTLCVFDPQCAYVPGATPSEPGMRYENLENLKEQFRDVFSCFLEKQIDTKNATLFRFPLRNSRMAEKSKLSSHVVSSTRIRQLLEKLREELFDILLFTNNISKVKISQVSVETGELIPTYVIQSSMTQEDLQQKNTLTEAAHEAVQVLQRPNFGLADIKQRDVVYTQYLRDSNDEQERWCVGQSLGISPDVSVPGPVQTAIQSGNMVVLPRGGVAYMIDKRCKNSLVAKPRNRKVFCFLPLPVHTDLIVHINGHFALGYENRRQLATSAEGEYKCSWNTFLLEQVIARAYVSLLKGLRLSTFGPAKTPDGNNTVVQSPRPILDMKLRMYQKAFPEIIEREPQWHCLVHSVYQTIAETNVCVLPCLKELPVVDAETGDGSKQQEESWQILWLPPAGKGEQKAFFTSLEDKDEEKKEVKSPSESMLKTGLKSLKGAFGWLRGGSTNQEQMSPPQKPDSQILKEVLQDCGFKILDVTPKLVENFQASNVQIDFMSPQGVIEFFKTYNSDEPACKFVELPADINETPFADIKTLKVILKYCKKLPGEDFQNYLDGLPLLLTNDGMVRVFDCGDVVFLSKFCDLVPAFGKAFVHKEMLDDVFKDVHPDETPLFKTFEVEDLAQILDLQLAPEIYLQNEIVVWEKNKMNVMNEKWMIQLWTYLASNQQDVLKDNDLDIEEKSVIVRDKMMPLKDWSLVPAYIGDKSILAPVGNAFQVMSFHKYDNKYENIRDIICKLNLPTLEMKSVSTNHANDILNFDLLFHIVTTLERPAAVLDVLQHMVVKKLLNVKLSELECTALLKYFNSNIDVLRKDDENKDKLRDLPFYTTIYKDIICLSGCFVYTLPSKIPTAGVEVWQSKSGTVFLERDDQLQPLYDFIECKSITAEEVYCTFIFQHFEYFSPEERMEHLYHVYQRYIKEGSTGFQNEDEKQHFMATLKELPFIEDKDGDLLPPSEFYDPENVVFHVMMEEDQFPPQPTSFFKDSEWYTFLRKLGLIQEVTQDRFLQYTTSVAREGIDPNSPSAEVKSKVLCNHLFKMQAEDRDEIMKQISDVAFIAPAKAPVQLSKLHPQHGDCGNGRLPYIPFVDSISKKYENVAWTSANVLPEWADPSTDHGIHDEEKTEIMENLGIQREPKAEIIVRHIKNLSENRVPDRPKIPEIRKAVFKSIYEHLNKRNSSGEGENFQVLSKVPCVVVENGKELVCPEQTVFNIYEEIKPYLFKVPIEFGEFQGLFRSLGSTERATPRQYALVLQKLKSTVKTSLMNPNETCLALKAMNGYFQALEDSGSTGQYDLYFPSEKGHLMESYRLVFNDSPAYYERVQGMKTQFMVDLRECGLKKNHTEDTIRLIPKDNRPALLSSLVSENLHHGAENSVSKHGIVAELEKRIQSDEFKTAVARLIKHGFHKAGQKINEDEMNDVIDRLSTLHMFGTEKVYTHLSYKGKNVDNSNVIKPCFVTSSDNNSGYKKWSIFIKKDAQLDQELLIPLAEVINTILSGLLKDSVLYLLPILSCSENEMHRKLNSLNIKVDHSHGTHRASVLPDLGNQLTDEHKPQLVQGDISFENDEFIAYKEADGKPFVYGRVQFEIEDPNGMKTYIISLGPDENGIIANVQQMYRFVRK